MFARGANDVLPRAIMMFVRSTNDVPTRSAIEEQKSRKRSLFLGEKKFQNYKKFTNFLRIPDTMIINVNEERYTENETVHFALCCESLHKICQLLCDVYYY